MLVPIWFAIPTCGLEPDASGDTVNVDQMTHIDGLGRLRVEEGAHAVGKHR